MISTRAQTLYCVLALLGATIRDVSFSHAASGGREELFIRKGVDLRKQGKNEAALAEFVKAFELAHTPRAAAQLGLCEQALSKWIDANLHLSVALAADTDPWVAQNKPTLQASLDAVQKHLGRIDFDGDPATAIVLVDREMLGRLSDKPNIFVEPGNVKVHIRADGFKTLDEVRSIEAGTSTKVHVNLLTVEKLPDVVLKQPSSLPSENGNDLSAASVEAQSGSGKPSLGSWVGWGGGAILIGAGVVFGLQSLAKADDAKNAERYSQGAVDEAKTARQLEWVFLGAGTVAAAIGTYLYLRGPGETKVVLGGGSLADAAALNWQGGW